MANISWGGREPGPREELNLDKIWDYVEPRIYAKVKALPRLLNRLNKNVKLVIADWREIGIVSKQVKEAAVKLAGSTKGVKYNKIWKAMEKDTAIGMLQATPRSDAIWLAEGWDEIIPWLDEQGPKRALNHPTAIHAEWRRTHPSPKLTKDDDDDDGDANDGDGDDASSDVDDERTKEPIIDGEHPDATDALKAGRDARLHARREKRQLDDDWIKEFYALWAQGTPARHRRVAQRILVDFDHISRAIIDDYRLGIHIRGPVEDSADAEDGADTFFRGGMEEEEADGAMVGHD